MRQVFFSNVAGQAAPTTGEGPQHFNDLTSGEVGVFDLDAESGGGGFFTSQLFRTGVETGIFDTSDATDATAQALTTLGKPIMLKNRIQIAQGYGSGNPIATPIIDTSKITRIKVDEYTATTRQVATVAYAADDSANEVQLKIVVKQDASSYINFVNNEQVIADVSGGNFHFPLGAFHANNHKVINISSSGTTDNGAGEAVTAIQNHGVLNALVTASQTSGTLSLSPRHAGVFIEVIADNITDNTSLTVDNAQTAYVAGVGNDWQARAAELKGRYGSGQFNRMYFPNTFTDFVANGDTFDKVEITYRIDGDRSVVKGSEYGSAVIYEKIASTTIQSIFNNGDPASGSTEYLF